MNLMGSNIGNPLQDLLVLACEGPELKGYMRKQANSKTVGKHMRNGGRTSFCFHPSPRMVRRQVALLFLLLYYFSCARISHDT